MNSAVAGLLGLAVMASASPARADLRLDPLPPGCPDQVDGRAILSARAGERADGLVTVERVDGGFRATVSQAHGATRAVMARTCEGGLEAIGLVLGLGAFDPPDDDEPQVLIEESRPIIQGPVQPARHVFGLRSGIALGLAPVAVGGVGVDAALTLGRYARAHAKVLQWFPADATFAGAGARIWNTTGALGLGLPLGQTIELEPQIAAGMALVVAEGLGVTGARTLATVVVLPSAGVSVAWPARGPWRAVGEAQLALPVTRPSVIVEGQGEVHRTGPVVGTTTAGVSVTF